MLKRSRKLIIHSSIVVEHLAFNCDLAVFEFDLREQLHGVCVCVWPSANTSVKLRTTTANC